MKPNSPRILASTIAALLTLPVVSHAAVRTWTGGGTSSTWSNAANWDTGVPQNGDTIVFAGTTKPTNFNDLSDLQLAGITFNNGGFALAGNPVTLNGPITNTGANTYALDTVVSGATTLTSNGGTFFVTSTLSGPGSLTRTGSAGVIFTGTNTFAGGVAGTGGDIQVGDSGATGNVGTGGIAMTAGVLSLRRTGALVMSSPITTNGNAFVSVGTPADPLSGLTLGPGTNNFGGLLSVGNGFDGVSNPIGNRFGRLFINTGTTVTGNQFFVGERSGGTGQVVQSGGDVTVNQVRVGHWPQTDVGAGVVSMYTISGGTLTLNGTPADGFNEGSAGIIFLGIDSTGYLKIDGGTVTAAAVSLDNRGATAGEDTLELNGGFLNIGARGVNSQNAGDIGTYEVKLSGGTYRAAASHTSDVEMTLVGGGAGVQIDTNGNTVTLPRALSGDGGFTKVGNGTLTLNGINAYTGPTSILGGTVNGTGNIPGGNVTIATGATLGGGLIVDGPVQLNGGTINGTVSLSNTLTMTGGLVDGVVNINGAVVANGGTIRTTGTLGSTLQLNAGALITGNTIVVGATTVGTNGRIESTGTFAGITLNAGAVLSPGSDSLVGTLAASSVNLGAGGNSLRWNVGTTTDLLTISASNGFTTSTTANTVIEIIPTGAIGAGTYDLIDYAGTIQGGGFSKLVLGQVPHIVAALVNDAVNTKVQLNVSGADTLIWTASASNVWDTNGAVNWKLQSTNAAVPFFAFDQVVFDQTAPTKTVQVAAAGVTPASMTFNATSDYTLQGGPIGAAGTLTKNNSNRLILLNDNTFTGATTVNGGVLQVGNGTSGNLGATTVTIAAGSSMEVNLAAAATMQASVNIGGALTFLGSNAYTASGVMSGNGITINMGATGSVTLGGPNTYTGTTIITSGTLRAGSSTALGSNDGNIGTAGDSTVINSGGTLDVNGQDLGAEEILVQGTGADGNGAIVNNGPNNPTLHNLYKVRLAGNTSIGGNNGRLEFRDQGIAGQIFDLAGFTLTKVGTNQASLVSIDMTPGSIVIDGGTFSIEANSLVDGAGTLSINLGGRLGLFANVGGRFTKPTIANGGGIIELGSGGGTVSSPLDLRANTPVAIAAGGGVLVWDALISETGGSFGLNVAGPGTIALTAADTFTGTSTITGGTLRIGNSGTAGSVPAGNLFVNSGAVEFRRTDKVTIPNMITNPGNNTAAGKVRINAGIAGEPTTGVELTGTINTSAVAVGEFDNTFGRLFISNSTNINTGTFFVGEQNGATGQVIQNGGAVTITGQFRVGHWPQSDPGGGFGTTSSYVLNSGTLTLTAAPGVAFNETNGNSYLGIDSTGALTINNGVFTTGGLVLDNRGATVGVDTFELDGGTMNLGVNGITSPNSADLTTYLVNLGGGTIHMTGSSSSNVTATLTGMNGSPTFDVDAGAVATWTGGLNGTGGTIKVGPGSLALAGANTASGQIAVAGGTLLANRAGNSSTGSGGVLVGTAGTLGGSGAVGDGGAVTVSLSGKLSPGTTGAGMLTFNLGSTGTLDLTGAVTPAASGAMLFDLGASAATSDKALLSTGKLTIGTGVLGIDDFSFTLLSGFVPGTYTLFDSSVAITGTLAANVTGTIAPGFTGTLSFADSGNDIVVQVIPEPGSAATLLVAGTLLGLRRRRRP